MVSVYKTVLRLLITGLLVFLQLAGPLPWVASSFAGVGRSDVLAPPSIFETDETAKTGEPEYTLPRPVAKAAEILNRLPQWAKVATSYLVVVSLAAVAYSFGIPSAAAYPVGNVLANMGLYTVFNVITDFMGQWISGNRVLASQIKAALPSGVFQAVATAIGYAIINMVFPKDGVWPMLSALSLFAPGQGIPMDAAWGYFIVANTRTLATFVVVWARTKIYTYFVKGARGRAARNEEEARQASLSGEKRRESYWMARGPSYVKNWIVQMYVPQEMRVAVEGVVTQFFQIFYTWSVNKTGFVIKDPELRKKTWFLIAYPFILPYAGLQSRRLERTQAAARLRFQTSL